MNPPINRENLRDVLIALAIAIGTAWAVSTYRGCAANTTPSLATMAARFISSREAPRNKVAQTQEPLLPSNF
jgi:hypothetical protein